MYLFSRTAMLTGGPRRAMPWVAAITTYVNERSDLDVAVWQANFGAPLGMVGWSARVASRAAVAASMGQLASDDGYWDLVEQGAEHLVQGSATDSLLQLVHGEPGESPPPVGSIAQIVSGVPVPGKLGEATAWAATIADRYASLAGAAVTVWSSAYGSFGQLNWIAAFADLAAVDAGNERAGADDAYVKAVDGGGSLFVPGSGHQMLLTRVL